MSARIAARADAQLASGPRAESTQPPSCLLGYASGLYLTWSMRASREGVTGNTGETEVEAKFRRLGWGVARNTRDDVGTDLWLMARDDRLFDLGLIVGAQVKTTADEFTEPAYGRDRQHLGWWWRDPDREHMDAWLTHAAPHLLVLHHLPTRTSHWVHVVPERVRSTGRGAKILVPIENTVEESCRDELLRVAATTRPGATWEGSAWMGAANMRPADALRHAMIVPRLVAPHPNAGYETPVTTLQAVAMLLQGRFRDLNHQANKQPTVPELQAALSSDDWGWRFVGALAAHMLGRGGEPLLALAEDPPDPASRAAAAVAAAATLLQGGLPEQALSVLEVAYRRDDAEPVDHAWLCLQMARAHVEIGHTTEARDLAVRVQQLGTTHADDPTATAIAGAGAILLFITTTDWRSADVASAVIGRDNIAAWWQNQTIVTGLTAAAKRQFSEWSKHRMTLLEDVANNNLYGAAFTASLLGDHPAWRHLSSLLAQDGLVRLDRHSESESAERSLRTLRLSGAADQMEHAVRRLIADGPCSAITAVGRDVNPDVSTRTTAGSDLTLLRVGGDLLESATADAAVEWLLRTIDNPSRFLSRTGGVSWTERLVDTLAGVLAAASPAVQRAIVDYIAVMPAREEQSAATAWARVVARLPREAWSHVDLSDLADSGESHHAVLAVRLRGVASLHARTRERLLQEAAAGSLEALEALGDVSQLPAAVVTPLIERLAAQVRQQVEQAHQGHFGLGGNDLGDALALLNVCHPAAAVWTSIIDLISDAAVYPEHKLGALRRLANATELIPVEVRDDLLLAAQAAAAQPTFQTPFGDRESSSPEAAELVAALRPMTDGRSTADGAMDLATLIAGDSSSRASAAKIAGRRGTDLDIGVLIGLSGDDEPSVREAAALGIASLAARSLAGGSAAQAVLEQVAQDPGRRVPHAIAAVLGQNQAQLSDDLERLRIQLTKHPSAMVRTAANRR
jgi:hypothetical protein